MEIICENVYKALIDSTSLFSHYINRTHQQKKLNDNFQSQTHYTLSYYIRAIQISST